MSLKFLRLANRSSRSLSISSQSPQCSEDGRLNSDGSLPSSSTNSQKTRDVMVESASKVKSDDRMDTRGNATQKVNRRRVMFSMSPRYSNWMVPVGVG